MSVKGALMSAMWTEIMEAMNKDWPDKKIPKNAGKELSRVIGENADYIIELTSGTSK